VSDRSCRAAREGRGTYELPRSNADKAKDGSAGPGGDHQGPENARGTEHGADHVGSIQAEVPRGDVFWHLIMVS
jgi:hypothetical protein